MDVAFHLVCHSGGLYEIVRTVAAGRAADRHSDRNAVSRVTVLKTTDYEKAEKVVELLRAAEYDRGPAN